MSAFLNPRFARWMLLLGLACASGCDKEVESQRDILQPVWVVQPGKAIDNRPQTYTGSIHARLESDLAFRVSGKVLVRSVDVGTRVKKGDKIANIDPTDYQLAAKAALNDYTSAKAASRRAALDEERLRRIRQSAAASQQEYDLAKANAESAVESMERAARNLEIAQNRLGYCQLTADFDGIVTEVHCEPGQVVAEGKAVVRVAGLGEREAVVGIPENQVDALPSRIATVSLWSQPEKKIQAKLRELSPIADPATRTFQARFTLLGDYATGELGMTATVTLSDPAGPENLSLPSTALFHSQGDDQVWVVNPATGQVSPRKVKVIDHRGDRIIIGGGLQTDDWVIRMGVHKIDPAIKVKIVEKGQ